MQPSLHDTQQFLSVPNIQVGNPARSEYGTTGGDSIGHDSHNDDPDLDYEDDGDDFCEDESMNSADALCPSSPTPYGIKEAGKKLKGAPSNPPSLRNVQWSSSDGTHFYGTGPTRPIIDAATYEIGVSDRGVYLEKVETKEEGLLVFPDTPNDAIVSEIQKFWAVKKRYDEFHLPYRRGILLYGPPGCGKSCALTLVSRDIIERGGIVLRFKDPNLFLLGYRLLREIEPNRSVVVVMEDIENYLQSRGTESELLQILDGAEKIENTVFLATTNFPELLGERLKNRPSRFDRRFEFKEPGEAARQMYLESLCAGHNFESVGLTRPNIGEWVKKTANFSLAHVKEVFTSVVILERDFEEVMEEMKKMKRNVTSTSKGETMGLRGESA